MAIGPNVKTQSDVKGSHRLTRQFQMSTHNHCPSLGERYGTRGTPIGIMRVTCRRGPLLAL